MSQLPSRLLLVAGNAASATDAPSFNRDSAIVPGINHERLTGVEPSRVVRDLLA